MKLNWKNIQWTKQKKMFAAVIALLLIVAIVFISVMSQGSKEEYVYKETKVKHGNLVVGVTESGTVDIGTVEQTFDLDMSALQRVETGSSSGSASGAGGSARMSGAGGGAFGGASGGGMSMGGMNMFSQMFNMGGNNVQSSGDDSSLTVSKVCVSVGQQVAEGDVLYELEEESVSELEQELQSNVEKAKADLDAVYADQELSKKTAEYTYETSIAYGDYAETEYNATVQSLQDTVDKNLLSLERAKETLNGYSEQLTTVTTAYNEALQALDNCEYSLSRVDAADDLYSYVYYYNYMQDAQSNVDSLEQKKEQLEKNLEQAQSNVEMLTKSYYSSERSLAQGLLSAKETLALRELAYETAQETYDITLAYLEEDASAQETIYQEAREKWDEFSSYINGNAVCAKYNGVITGVELAEGDSINTGSSLVTLYDMDEVTMTVTVYEKDMTDITLGSLANITFTAYPDEVFQGEVTEISDASTDSGGNVTYDVTATIQGDVSGLFQGMTGDITFVTEQSQNVLYVSRRAIITENNKSYVKVKDDNGNIKRKEVTTGFSDGVSVEIVEGLSEGETVLIESKVSGS